MGMGKKKRMREKKTKRNRIKIRNEVRKGREERACEMTKRIWCVSLNEEVNERDEEGRQKM